MDGKLDQLWEQSLEHGLSPDTKTLAQSLHNWLCSRLTPNGLEWLNSVIEKNLTSGSERVFFARFSEVPRRIGKADLDLSTTELQTAAQLSPGWNPSQWSVDQAARSLLMLTFITQGTEHYQTILTKLLTAADISEQIAWYQSLPLLPDREVFKDKAIDGLRSNMKAVFDAIALRNPYPAQYFGELAWNQMVLKALFIESALSEIQGLDKRANPTLARMLRDYAHERWAAGRDVNVQLWRLVGPYANDDLVADLERALAHPSPTAQQAAALACASAPSEKVRALLSTMPYVQEQIQNKELTWDKLSQITA